jgi:mRNA interferase RelE/StbE
MSEPPPRYQVLLERQPEKVLRRLPRDLVRRIDEAVRGLERDPRPPGCRKLSGHETLYRIRVGDWRIIYAVEEDRLVVLVIEITPRGDAYHHL